MNTDRKGNINIVDIRNYFWIILPFQTHRESFHISPTYPTVNNISFNWHTVSAQSYLQYLHHLFDLIDGSGFAAWQMLWPTGVGWRRTDGSTERRRCTNQSVRVTHLLLEARTTAGPHASAQAFGAKTVEKKWCRRDKLPCITNISNPPISQSTASGPSQQDWSRCWTVSGLWGP